MPNGRLVSIAMPFKQATRTARGDEAICIQHPVNVERQRRPSHARDSLADSTNVEWDFRNQNTFCTEPDFFDWVFSPAYFRIFLTPRGIFGVFVHLQASSPLVLAALACAHLNIHSYARMFVVPVLTDPLSLNL